MRYCVKIDETGRVQYITQEEYASPDMIFVGYLPDGDVTDYRMEGGKLVYDPLPEPGSPPEPENPDSIWDELAAAIREGVNSV